MWCRGGKSNPHALRRRCLRPLRLPIPSPRHRMPTLANFACAQAHYPTKAAIRQCRPRCHIGVQAWVGPIGSGHSAHEGIAESGAVARSCVSCMGALGQVLSREMLRNVGTASDWLELATKRVVTSSVREHRSSCEHAACQRRPMLHCTIKLDAAVCRFIPLDWLLQLLNHLRLPITKKCVKLGRQVVPS